MALGSGGCGSCIPCPEGEPHSVVETMEKTVDVDSGLGIVQVRGLGQYNNEDIKECLSRLSEAEAALAGVRSVLTKVVNQSRDTDMYGVLQPAAAPVASTASSNPKPDNAALASAAEEPTAPKVVPYISEGCYSNSSVSEDQGVKSKFTKTQSELDTRAPTLAKDNNISEATVRKVFQLFESANKSGDGQLTMGELEMLLIDMCDGSLEKSQLHYIMQKFDADGDGMLRFDEFVVAFVNTPLMKVAHIGDDLREKGQETRDDMAEAGMRLQPEDWVQMVGCKALSVKHYVNKEMAEAGSCASMPLVFAMFLLYFLSVALHLDYERLHAVDKAITFDIKENSNFAFGGDVPFENGRMGHKNIYDVNSFADFWSWLDLGIVPIFWAEGWELSEVRSNAYSRCMDAKEQFKTYGYNLAQLPNSSSLRPGMITGDLTNPYYCAQETPPARPGAFYDNDQQGTYLYYHSVVAGVRLRQERGIAEPCPNSDGALRTSLHRGQCVPAMGYFLKPEPQTSFGVDSDLANRKGGETIYLKSRKSQADIRNELHTLEDQLWLGPETQKVEVLLTLYNPHLDIFSAAFIIIFMNRGGHMYKMVEPVSTYLTEYRYPLGYVVDILLLILILKILFGEGMEVLRAVRLKGFRTGVSEYLSPGNFVDWASVIYFFILMAFWLAHLQLIGKLRDTLRPADTSLMGSFANTVDRDNFYDLVDEWVQGDSTMRTVMALFPFIIGARFFKVFSLQPRLGVVTATLRLAFVDIIHFFMVFAAIFLVFVTAAMIIFGQEIEDFTNFGRCTMTVFQIMMGDYETDRMNHVARHSAAAWYWCFTWLVNLVMLNMLLAIIMDVYTEVKGNISSDSETMWSQVGEIVCRWNDVRVGRQIDLDTILTAMEKHHPPDSEDKEKERLTLQSFMAIVPNMPEHQAMRILVNTYTNDEEEGSGRGCSQSETSTRVGHIFKNTQILHSSIERLIHMHEITADMITTHFAAARSNHHHKHKSALRTISLGNVSAK